MNTIIKKLIYFLILIGLVACAQDSKFDEEQYKKVIYLLSSDDLTFPVVHNLNEDISTGYLTVYCGGTVPLDQDVKVEIETDTNILNDYNYLHYDLDTAKYARKIDPKRYEIPEMSVVLKAKGQDPYTLIPVKVRTEGLSPDSMYIIPLRIKSVSAYEINPKKQNVLYRVYLTNDYADQATLTYYATKGTKIDESSQNITVYTNKVLHPLKKNTVRMFAGIQPFVSNLESIKKYAVILQVNEDKSVTILPYGTIQVEMVGALNDNRYDVSNGMKRFILSYRYRTLELAATATTIAKWSNWITMTEIDRRLE